MIKYPPVKEGDGVLLRLREDYEQAVLDLFEADQEAKEVRPALAVVGHTSNFLDNMRLPVHRWFRYSAGFSAEWVKWLLAERDVSELRVLDPFVGSGTSCLACDEMGVPSHGIEAHPVRAASGTSQVELHHHSGTVHFQSADLESAPASLRLAFGGLFRHRRFRAVWRLCAGHRMVREAGAGCRFCILVVRETPRPERQMEEPQTSRAAVRRPPLGARVTEETHGGITRTSLGTDHRGCF